MFNKFSLNRSENRLLEEQLYEQVAQELSEGKQRSGLWAKALADSEGSEDKAKALYLKYRVQSLKDESNVTKEIISQQKEAEERRKEQILADQNLIQQAQELKHIHQGMNESENDRVATISFVSIFFIIMAGLIVFYALSTKDIDMSKYAGVLALISAYIGYITWNT